MGGVVSDIWDVVVNLVEAVWGIVSDVVDAVWQAVWDNILNPILEPLFGLFGFEDKTVVETQVTTQRYFSSDEFIPTLTKAIIRSTTDNVELFSEVKLAILNNVTTSSKKYYYYGFIGDSRTGGSTVNDGYVNGTPTGKYSYQDTNVSDLRTILTGFHSGASNVTLLEVEFGDFAVGAVDTYRYWSWWQMEQNEPTWNHGSKTWIESNYNTTPCYIPASFTEGFYWEGIVDTVSYYDATVDLLAAQLPPAWEAISADYTNATLNTVNWPYLGNSLQAEVVIDYENLTVPTSTTILIDQIACTATPPAGATVVCGYTAADVEICPTPTLVTATWNYVDTTINGGNLDINFTGTYGSRVITVIFPDLTRNYIVEYQVIGGTDNGKQFIWAYDTSTGVYPQIEQQYDGALVDGYAFFPIACLKRNFAYVNASKTTQEYLTTKKLLGFIDIDLDASIDAIKSNVSDANVTDAFVLLAANLYDDNQSINKYLFGFFAAIANQSNVNKAQYDSQIGSVTNAPYNIVGIEEQNFSLAIEFSYIDIVSKTGNVGPINWVNKSIQYTGTKVKNHYTDRVVFTVQDTPTSYTEMTIQGLVIAHFVSTTIGTIKSKAFRITPTNPASGAYDKNSMDNFCFPLSSAIFNYFGNISDKETVIYRSVRFVVYAEQITYLEWYETPEFVEFFGIVLQIAAVIIAFYNPEAGFELWALVEQVLIQLALQVALELVLKSTDNEFLIYLAYILYAAGSAMNAGFSPFDLGDPAVALSFVDSLAKSYMRVDTIAFEEEFEDFTQTRKEYEEELERAESLLEAPSEFAQLITYLKSDLVLNYESPDEFFRRTLDTNPGVRTLGTIESFYTRMLRLPQLDPRMDTGNITIVPTTV